ncbi:hypothetical protein [Actibacterium sp. 188UL27-1]|uniref:hypothetical protein n=1 Tax=Actibacterium sp. 188UL27-1 TaxID=2786961 RepID=UPI00195C55A7|nr:hypothetical protein [Actibacterium sp. 188UL27-1]MBM7068635.1 hypothetical protein [Actibacterium sp. 188UL27-1]
MRILIPICLFLAACGTATPGFMGAEPTRLEVDGMTFDVRLRADEAEAQRRNVKFGVRWADVAPRAGIAIERVSGCQVRPGSLTGDPSVVFAQIDCG